MIVFSRFVLFQMLSLLMIVVHCIPPLPSPATIKTYGRVQLKANSFAIYVPHSTNTLMGFTIIFPDSFYSEGPNVQTLQQMMTLEYAAIEKLKKKSFWNEGIRHWTQTIDVYQPRTLPQGYGAPQRWATFMDTSKTSITLAQIHDMANELIIYYEGLTHLQYTIRKLPTEHPLSKGRPYWEPQVTFGHSTRPDTDESTALIPIQASDIVTPLNAIFVWYTGSLRADEMAMFKGTRCLLDQATDEEGAKKRADDLMAYLMTQKPYDVRYSGHEVKSGPWKDYEKRFFCAASKVYVRRTIARHLAEQFGLDGIPGLRLDMQMEYTDDAIIVWAEAWTVDIVIDTDVDLRDAETGRYIPEFGQFMYYAMAEHIWQWHRDREDVGGWRVAEMPNALLNPFILPTAI